jgi:hypothetical protein
MYIRERISGQLLWMLNSVAIRVGGALLNPQVHMVWGFGRIFFFFFYIYIITCAEGHNPSIQDVYKVAPTD